MQIKTAVCLEKQTCLDAHSEAIAKGVKVVYPNIDLVGQIWNNLPVYLKPLIYCIEENLSYIPYPLIRQLIHSITQVICISI